MIMTAPVTGIVVTVGRARCAVVVATNAANVTSIVVTVDIAMVIACVIACAA